MSGEWEREGANERLGAGVRSRRDEKGMSQTELARLMTDRGHSWYQSTVYRVESGKQAVSFEEAVNLAEILGVALDRFRWGTAEANEAEFVAVAGTRVRRQYEVVAAAVREHLACMAAAERILERPPQTDTARVREARDYVAERLEQYSLDDAIDEGIRRYEERDQEEGDDDGGDAEGEPGIVDQQRA